MKKLYTLLLALFLFSHSFAAVSAIEGANVICLGTSTTLTDSITVGIWSSNNLAILTITDMGVATGIAAGTAVVTYSTSGGYVTCIMTVISASSIEGIPNTVVGDSTSLTDTVASGIWSSSNPPVATVGSTSGHVQGVSAGTAVITYTVPSGCYVADTITVYEPLSPIGGADTICDYGTTILSDTVAGGLWSSSDTVVATVNAVMGTVTGIAPGTAIITYQLPVGVYKTLVLTVLTTPAPVAITGISGMLVGYSVSLSDASFGGVWASSNTFIATSGSTGIVQGISTGTAYISYTIPDGCFTISEITVYDSLPGIAGPIGVCTGATAAFTDSVGGGTWGSSDTAVATVDSAGIVIGLSAGTVNITYTLDSNYVIQVVTVNQSPAPIQGGPFLYACAYPYYTTLTDTPTGGMWSSSDTAYIKIGDTTGAMIGGTGWMGAFWADSSVITYTLPDGCYTTLTAYIYCEGIPTIANTNNITIFPNPASTSLTIQSSSVPISQLFVTDVLGKKVSCHNYAAGGLQVNVDVSALPGGIYFVKVNGSEVGKFVKE